MQNEPLERTLELVNLLFFIPHPTVALHACLTPIGKRLFFCQGELAVAVKYILAINVLAGWTPGPGYTVFLYTSAYQNVTPPSCQLPAYVCVLVRQQWDL